MAPRCVCSCDSLVSIRLRATIRDANTMSGAKQDIRLHASCLELFVICEHSLRKTCAPSALYRVSLVRVRCQNYSSMLQRGVLGRLMGNAASQRDEDHRSWTMIRFVDDDQLGSHLHNQDETSQRHSSRAAQS